MESEKEPDIVLDQYYYKAIVLGTGIKESVLSAALSLKEYSSLNLDVDKGYASAMKTYNLKEYLQYFEDKTVNPKKSSALQRLHYESHFTEDEVKNLSKHFNIDLQPKLLYSKSLTVDKMIDAKMDQYMDFRALESILFYDEESAKFVKVPANKTDIFSNEEFTLIEKRDLFKILHLCVVLHNHFSNILSDMNSTSEYDKDLDMNQTELQGYLALKKQ
jgi:RAB protein geranylgeranyltransferase component A